MYKCNPTRVKNLLKFLIDVMVHNVYSSVNLKQMHLNALQYSYKLYLTLNITIVINFDVTMVIYVNIHVIEFKKNYI